MLELIIALVDLLASLALFNALAPEGVIATQRALGLAGAVGGIASFAVAVALAGRVRSLLKGARSASAWQVAAILVMACCAAGLAAYVMSPELVKLSLKEAAAMAPAGVPESRLSQAMALVSIIAAASAVFAVVVSVAVNALIAWIGGKLLKAGRLGYVEAFKAYGLGQVGTILGALVALAALSTGSALTSAMLAQRLVDSPVLISIIVGYACGCAEEGEERRYVASIMLPLLVFALVSIALSTIISAPPIA